MFLYYPLVPIFLICPFLCFLVLKNQRKKGLKWPLVNATVEPLLIKCGPWGQTCAERKCQAKQSLAFHNYIQNLPRQLSWVIHLFFCESIEISPKQFHRGEIGHTQNVASPLATAICPWVKRPLQPHLLIRTQSGSVNHKITK